MRRILLATAALASLAGGYAAVAQSTDDPAIKARRAYFTLLGANVGPLAAMAKGEIEYDAAAAELHAGNLSQLTAYAVTPHFPAGTANADKPGETRALPEIWSDLDGFMEKYEDLVMQVDALQSVAGAGRGELGGALGQLGGTCKACHDDYRAADF